MIAPAGPNPDIQNINIPGKDEEFYYSQGIPFAEPVYATPYVPQRSGTIFGGRANSNVADIMQTGQKKTQQGLLKDLETQKLKNRLEIMKLDVQIKAHNA